MDNKNTIFQKYLTRIESTPSLTNRKKVKAYFRLVNLILEELSDEDRINFTSLFSRIVYVGAKHKIDGKNIYLIHTLRRAFENEELLEIDIDEYVLLSRYCCQYLMHKGLGEQVSYDKDHHLLFSKFQSKSGNKKAFYNILSGLIIRVDEDKKELIFLDEKDGSKEMIVKYDIAHRNEIFTPAIKSVAKYMHLPVHVNLVDVDHQEDDSLMPKAFVIEPDYMVDVTAIANAFKYYGTEPLESIVKKYKPLEMSVHLLLGNIANYLLDELVNNRDIEFITLIPKIFQLSPIPFSCLDNKAVISVLEKANMHFDHLKNVINVEFEKEGIDTSNVYLEPSYYSRDYGIQGRLDLLHEHRFNKHYDIVELKSGSPFMPNNYGLSVQHYTQTLLYDLIIKSVYRGGKRTSNYILYSKEEEWQLRNAPVLKVQQYEALKTRNDLLMIEHLLGNVIADGKNNIIFKVKSSNFPKAKGFLKDDVKTFQQVFSSSSVVEKSYFLHFSQFIAKEHRLAKTGEHGLSKSNGLAALWLEENGEKEDRFSILHNLAILDNKSADDMPVIQLSKTPSSPRLSRFREGDIVVLYPQTGKKSILRNQIFKCNVIGIDKDKITLKLRSRQYNQSIFDQNKLWAIEGDMMDSSFLTMYRSLFKLMSSPIEKRKLILGIEPPELPEVKYNYYSEELTEEQNHLLNQMINSKDYYLLWGPPGTGKTSVMIKHLVKYLYYHTDENIMLLAYTNRAVDEICDAIIHALEEEEVPFIRIGSSHACGEDYKKYLLDHSIGQYTKRREIINFLKSHRIIVSTLSSIINRVEIFYLYQFDTCIIDEASQILEPSLAGLLPQYGRFIMIGDHKQLPAVVVQHPNDTLIQNDDLQSLGFSSTSMSLFERLYLRCKSMDWIHAYGILTAQGRMHEDLMAFPNKYFYEGRLKLIEGLERLQSNDEWKDNKTKPNLLIQKRITYIPTKVDEEFSWKTNTDEAKECIRIINSFIRLYKEQNKEWHNGSLGVITPYRAQIAMISQQIEEEVDSSVKDLITVDTVERYQGGARDIIIISLCTNRMDQLERLVSMSYEGVDRKLNVALTRARERIFILGHEEILQSNQTYSELINHTRNSSSSSS